MNTMNPSEEEQWIYRAIATPQGWKWIAGPDGRQGWSSPWSLRDAIRHKRIVDRHHANHRADRHNKKIATQDK
jgi:hypothetical protein